MTCKNGIVVQIMLKKREKKSTNNAPHSLSYYKDPSGKKVEENTGFIFIYR